MSLEKQKASKRLQYQVLLMKKHIRLNKISIKEISIKSGIKSSIVWKFFNVSKEPSALTFLMIAEAIGFEININLKRGKEC